MATKKKSQEQESSFSYLYNTHFAILCVYAYRFIPDREICSDMVQESFARLWKNRDVFLTKDIQIQFLYTTIRNLALNNLRHEKVKRDFQMYHDAGNFIELNIIENEAKRIIWRNIIQLPDKYKEILILSLQGYSVKEISQKIDKPLQTVKNNKTIAMKLLKEKLNLLHLF